MKKNEEKNRDEKDRQPQQPADLDKMISDMEKRIADIEMEEILSGYTAEELEEIGFIGDNAIEVEHSKYLKRKFAEGYEFPEDVIYQKHYPVESVDQIESIVSSENTVVYPGTTVIKLTVSSGKLNYYNKEFNDVQYQKECNLNFEKENNVFKITPKVPGRLVLAGHRLYLIPADKDGKCVVRISDDYMSAHVDIYQATGNGARLTEEMILNELQLSGVKAGIKIEVIRDALKRLNTGDSEKNILVAEGRSARDGKDAPIQFLFDPEPVVEEFRVLPDGRVDYRKQANIRMTKKGDILAVVGKAEPGIDGYNVLGKVIKAINGESNVLCAGQNVIVTDDGKFKAVCDGQISLNGKVLSVFLHYVVEGDVDYGCGNISFNGNVTIKGSVLPGFEVKAEGDIVVLKNVDRATLKAGRDIIISSGIIGCKESIVTCGRNLSAQYLQNATVEAQGNVNISNSIVQSVVYSAGNVVLNGIKGMITGGYVCAMNGIDAKIIGSQYGTKTTVEVGKDYLVQKKIQEIEKAIQFCIDNVKKIDSSLLSIHDCMKKGLVLSPDKLQKVKAVQEKRAELVKHKEIMQWKKKELEKKAVSNTFAVIRIEDTIYTDVVIKIDSQVMTVKTDANRVKFHLDSKKEKIVSNRI